MARIDAPLLNDLHLYFQLTFGIPRLTQIIHRMENFKTPHRADINFHYETVDISLTSKWLTGGDLRLEFECYGLDKQLSLLEQVFSQFFPLLSHVGSLELF